MFYVEEGLSEICGEDGIYASKKVECREDKNQQSVRYSNFSNCDIANHQVILS